MRVLCVAEKPSQARTLAQLLSRNQFRQRRGLNKYCNNFDFEYRLKGNLVPVTMTSVLGHVMEHDFDAEYRKWSVCDPCDLLAAPVLRSVPEKMHNVAQNVRDEARRATHLYIWTDCDREGEAIGAEVAQLAREANSRIVVRRAHYSAITMDAVDRAMVGVRDLNMREVAAVEARSELDLRTGAALTRLQTLRLQNLFSEVKGNVLSYGK
ncbi:DNA topoisomerase [Spiromyces aspiralis]|uniref:DNA topoisomerase n=1 Tax=Spiromyces aspiralis TaxID=68401 RepID=A0ACC1HB76_9FUNG|nr:DNA topoisomerase [Spiromyces aspiralis]